MLTLRRSSSLVWKLVPLVLSLGLAGCGISTSPSVSALTASGLAGHVHGGVNPVIGATVTLWETQTGNSSSYGSAGKVLATTTTNSNGEFAFTTTYTCTSTEYVYVTATGGNTGGNAVNNQSLMMAALGSCSNFSGPSADANIYIAISEVTTAAAAYSLANFISVTDAGDGLQTVSVGAPQNNAASSPACSGTGASMTCTAGGLQHAFANAANLVDAVHFDGTVSTGNAYSVAPSNTDSVAPQSLLNTLGNVIQACTNTGGGLATSTPASNCKSLFTYTTPSGGSAPVDTLEALLSMVKYPANSVANIYALATPNSFFQPSLSTAPTDFSLAIFYFGTVAGGTTTPFTVPNALTLDAADNVYVERSDATSGSATYEGISGLAANGSSLFTGPTENTYVAPEIMSVDDAGHVWLSSNTGSLNSVTYPSSLQAFSTTNGAVLCALAPSSGYARGLAIDRFNNVWFSRASTSAYTLGQFPAPTFSGSSCTSTQTAFTTPPFYSDMYPWGIAIDANQNVWGVIENSGNGYAYLFPNTGTAAAPAYANSLLTTSSATFANGYGVAIDNSGNGWIAFNAKQAEIVPTSTAGVVSSIAYSSTYGTGGASVAFYPEFDGANTMWYPGDTTGGYVWAFPTTSSAPTSFRPCYAAAGGPTCVTSELSDANDLQVDSTGSIWVSASTHGVVAQVIGIAQPTWPQLSYGHPAVKPQ